MNRKELLLSDLRGVLVTIDFPGDKEAYINNFIEKVDGQTTKKLVELLPEEKKNKLKAKIEQFTEQKVPIEEGGKYIFDVIKDNYSSSMYVETWMATARFGFQDCIRSLSHGLEPEKLVKLDEYFKNIEKESLEKNISY